MIEVKTKPRYKCDYCKKRAVKWIMEAHEKTCFRNPNRVCYLCNNTGVTEGDNGLYTCEIPCYECAKFSKEMFDEIDKYKEISR